MLLQFEMFVFNSRFIIFLYLRREQLFNNTILPSGRRLLSKAKKCLSKTFQTTAMEYKTSIKCALLSLGARDWDKLKWPRLQSLSWMLCAETKHVFKALQFGGLFSLLLLSRNLSFFQKWINLQRFLPVLIFFIICGQREMCLSLRQVVPKIYWSESNLYFSQTIGQRFCCTLCVLHRDQYLKDVHAKIFLRWDFLHFSPRVSS